MYADKENRIYFKSYDTLLVRMFILGRAVSLHLDIEDQCFQTLTSFILRLLHISCTTAVWNPAYCQQPLQAVDWMCLYLLLSKENTLDFRLVGGNVSCVAFSVFRFFRYLYRRGRYKRISMCILKHDDDRWKCSNGCNYIIMDISRIADGSDHSRLCEIVFIV